MELWTRHTPVIRVRGRFRRLTSVSDLCSYKPGEKSLPSTDPAPIFYSRAHASASPARPSRPPGAGHTSMPDGPIVVVWDRQSQHPSGRRAAAVRRRTRPVHHHRLPTRPTRTPSKPSGESCPSDTAFAVPDDLDRKLRRELRRIQPRPAWSTPAPPPPAWPSTHRPRPENVNR